MLYLLVWWVVLVLIGFAALPVAFRFFPHLPDRGYAFAKPLGLLLIVYPFWLLTSFGFLQNTFGSIAMTIIVVTVAAWGVTWWRRESDSLRTWLRENAGYVGAVEAVFAIAYLAFAYYRSFNPEITATEKPMEFMFLNSILKSLQFPPHDSWLSGYAISYYYLGYTIVALLTKLTSIPSSIAFNLGLTMIYALSAAGAFGLGYNLVKGLRDDNSSETRKSKSNRGDRSPYVFGIFAVVLLLVVGNLEAPFEALHNVGIGSPDFYASLDINGLADAPKSGSFVPADNWWWWRASRVVNDHNPTTGAHIEVIDEFPSFSFLLGDLHPHVLALPFDLLALAVAFNLLRRPRRDAGTISDAATGLVTPATLLTAVIVGSLGMLNTWDLVTYGFIIIAAYAVAQVRDTRRWSRAVLIQSALFGFVLFAASVLLYLVFYSGFSSQVQGIAPAVFFKTPLQQYLMMFGIFVFILTSFVGVLMWQRRRSLSVILREALFWVPLFVAFVLLIAVIGLVVLSRSAELRDQVAGLLNVPNSDQVAFEVLGAYFRTLLTNPGVFLLLAILLSCIIALLRKGIEARPGTDGNGLFLDTSVIFALLLAFTGFLLTLGVEFLYVRDVFGSRMNTVFKLYHQAWTLFSVAGAFGAYYIWQNMSITARTSGHLHLTPPADESAARKTPSRPPPTRSLRQQASRTGWSEFIRLARLGAIALARTVWVGAFAILLALSLVFPVLAYPNRANDFQANTATGIPTLDGTLWIKYSNADDYAGIQWLNTNAPDDTVILEAPGPEYTFYDRVSVATGLEAVLGWGGHEFQWRGTSTESDKRSDDIQQIYTSLDPIQTRALLQKYGVDYVIVGGVEREKYGLTRPMTDKFGKLGQMVFNQGSMQIYMVDP